MSSSDSVSPVSENDAALAFSVSPLSEQIDTKERGCVLPLDQIQELTEINPRSDGVDGSTAINRDSVLGEMVQTCTALAFPSASISENDLSADVERKQKETKRKRQILAFLIVWVLIVGGVIIEKIKF
jgi:hypothetical protein